MFLDFIAEIALYKLWHNKRVIRKHSNHY